MFLRRLFNFIPKSEFSKALGLFNTGQYRKALKKFEELRAVSEQHEDVVFAHRQPCSQRLNDRGQRSMHVQNSGSSLSLV